MFTSVGKNINDAGDQRLQALVGCIHGIVMEWDRDARYLNVWFDDPALLAVPREQAIGRTIDEVLGPQAGPMFTAIVQRVFDTGVTEHLEYPIMTAQGGLRWFFCDIRKVPAGDDHTVVAFARDITERKQAEAALALAEERHRLAARATRDIIYDLDMASKLITYGSSALTDFPLDGVTPLDVALAYVHPDDVGRVSSELTAKFASDEEAWNNSYRYRRSDGSYAHILDRGFIVRHEGKPVRMVGMMTDVTEVKRLQAQLVQQDRLAALGLLAAGVGHEINNPLVYVLGNLDLAIAEEPLATTDEARAREADVREALVEARDGARRIVEIVKGLKLFSRSDGPAVSPVEIADVVESAIKLAENELRHRARLVRRYDAVPAVLVNEPQLGQVVLNLLINAAQALPIGESDHHAVTLSSRVDESGRVCLDVNDTGAGIPPEIVDRIFDPFFTTKPVGVGTGIGLSVCMSIVQSMGGELSVTSRPGATTFTVALPAAPAVAVAA